MSQNVDYKQLVSEWLESEDKDLEAGALLMLKLNRNRTLYQYILRKNALDKLIYEMKKQFDILSARTKHESIKLTEQQVSDLTAAASKATKTLEVVDKGVKGKRADHDLLSVDSQQAFENNLAIYPKMRSLHEKLKLMVNDRPCDRFPFLKELITLDNQVRANWKLYDNAKVQESTQPGQTVTNPVKPITPVLDVKGVSAARKYLSDNKKKLADLKVKDEAKHSDLLFKMQERYNNLIASGQTFDEKQVAELKDAGLNVEG